ncbi:site-specific DNA-methyltransferase [Sphingomonas sanguinis]|jgi:adenine-specific DNA-methyltransferase|uniref:site-specific DNA-methyltransferase (adenine-specific) n=1 Tax=Sphingomonas sanguinis TaxID=33051 RepID=A0A7Y7QXA6_9SPHN|nr:site-specific DNA-methyltransferase [Sphingomonas sanguinis]MBZ6382836.1 site-specific DNA-methyltransferase [Sphingomonas sanguinis]NNG51581.1 site-specific DNA-methyltransferase [Sphingomonas sanguinis]NNG52390.1 site-specific DNA-methyltransferase [Sphingomonas sanguinis]NVP32136.1 site-specific DNA-methyltransferase [Sphingomonas sanguinis]
MAKKPLTVDTLTHDEASRKNAPTAELEAFVPPAVKTPIRAAYERRNPDLDPQLVWRGKDVADWSDLIVEAPPLYIQEKIHPKALIEDLKAASERRREPETAPDLFADFNGIEPDQRTEFYEHDQHWSNRMILGDGLKVMASLAEREGLKGQVQCIYIDPPYGIKFNSNFQWSTTSRDVKDGKADHFSREPEQVKAFRDTWADGIHSYLTYLRDRLTVARDLLTDSGSVFVQIGDENVHRVRALMDEVFGSDNFVVQITVVKTSGLAASSRISASTDYILWYSRDNTTIKYRALLKNKNVDSEEGVNFRYVRDSAGVVSRLTGGTSASADTAYRVVDLTKPGPGAKYDFHFQGKVYVSGSRWWGTTQENLTRVAKSGRITKSGNNIGFLRAWRDYDATPVDNVWTDTGTGGFLEDKVYVVQTIQKIVQRCILMTTDPGDLVLDPTCGSGTTAYVAEQWGRRWITIDTSRVALALARARIMGARYPWYLLADSRDGQLKEAEVTRAVPRDTTTYGRIRQGFVYKRVPHITLKSIANNAEIDTIWAAYQEKLEPLRAAINAALGTSWQEWEIPRELSASQSAAAEAHAAWWEQRIARQKEIDASIAAKAETEYLYDQPYEEKGRVRVAGPFTVESLSPHRVPAVDVDDSLFDELEAAEGRRQKNAAAAESADFAEMVLENLKRSGVQQAHKADRLVFSSLKPWPGKFVCAEGAVRQASEGESDTLADSPTRRAAILIGPEYGTVARADLTAAAREAMEAGFDLLIAASFNFDAHASEFDRMGALTVLQARINPDLHMPDLANTGAGNLFTVFGEPDIQVHDEDDGCISIELAGVDMYKGGEIVASDPDDIAVWFIDTDYNYESFFVRHAYFPGANDPYKALKTTLKAEIDGDAWESLKRTRSRPFPRPKGGRVAVKVINHLGDEVMKVVGV